MSPRSSIQPFRDTLCVLYARISRGNPPVPLEFKTLLQPYRFESS